MLLNKKNDIYFLKFLIVFNIFQILWRSTTTKAFLKRVIVNYSSTERRGERRRNWVKLSFLCLWNCFCIVIIFFCGSSPKLLCFKFYFFLYTTIFVTRKFFLYQKGINVRSLTWVMIFSFWFSFTDTGKSVDSREKEDSYFPSLPLSFTQDHSDVLFRLCIWDD